MIKKLLILFFLVNLSCQMIAQKYGNEWINYSQKYYRINIPKTGLYRISYSTLQNSGIPLATINPKNFQLFIKGEEQYIHVNGENDNVFDAADYIEFFGKKNDATFDSLIYTDIKRLTNPYIPLFNDTNYAFITWNNSLSNRRLTIESDVNFSGYNASNYFYTERISVFLNNYSIGSNFLNSFSDPRYTAGEGYGNIINKGESLTSNFGNLKIYSNPNLPVQIKASFSGNSLTYIPLVNFDHDLNFEYLDESGKLTQIKDKTFLGYTHHVIEQQLTSDKLQNTSYLKVSNVNNPSLTSQTHPINIHYLYLKYPQVPDFSNSSEQLFFTDKSINTLKTFLEIKNVNMAGSKPILYDLTNHKLIQTINAGDTVKAIIPNGVAQNECFLTTESNINNISSLRPVNQTGFFTNYTSANTDSAFIIVYHSKLISAANQYKKYRESFSGGSHHVVAADIDDLYNQFAYGNVKNPLAIKNFARFLSNLTPNSPKYLLLLGKSIKNDLARYNNQHWKNNLLPTLGTPSADNLYTAGMKGEKSFTPFIPTGRVSAKTDLEAMQYLNKIIAHEKGLTQNPAEDWHKRIMHFSGGQNTEEQELFKSYLQKSAQHIQDTLYGAKVFSFQKSSTAPIQTTISDSVNQLINYGTSMITFFGHGSVGGFDQAIDDPNLYNNKDKYPLFVANSCYSGDIHLPEANSTSEKFTLIDQKGSIGFIASSSAGVISPLGFYTDVLYQSFANESYYKGIGDAIKNTIINTDVNNLLQEITGLEMTLEGDPSVKLNAFLKPDYEIKNSYVNIESKTYVDSIGITIFIKNNGKSINDTFIVSTEHYLPNGDLTTYLKKIKAPYNNTTLKFNIPKNFDKSVGINRFSVYIDSYNEINELSENNNSTMGTINVFIPGGDVSPVFPYKYAIIPKTNQITLKASTNDPFSTTRNYKIQLDTNDSFKNPINSIILSAGGGVINWTVNLPVADSTVYFWRISQDSTLPIENFNWKESSFQVIENKYGWAQAHFHQFKENKFQFVKYKKSQRKFDFENDITTITCRNGLESENLRWDQITYFVNTTLEHVWTCAYNGWSIAIFDTISGQPIPSTPPFPATGNPGLGIYKNCHCSGNRLLYAFDFAASTANCGSIPLWKKDLEDMLNAIPPNTKVLAYTQGAHQASTYNSALITAFAKIGADVTIIPDTVSSIIFGKKTNSPIPGSAKQIIGANRKSVLLLNDSIKTNWNSGFIASEIIGPATRWNSLHWKLQSLESPTTDSVILKIVGIKLDGTRDTLITFPKDSTDVLDLYNYVDAKNYPNIQLIAYLKDNTFNTPIQLKKWQIIYNPVPECAINAQKGFVNNSTLKVLQQGDNLVVYLPIENIGSVPFNDSLLVTYWIEDANKMIHALPQKLKAKPFLPNQLFIDTINFKTFNNSNINLFTGFNYLWVDVNPEQNAKHQLEQYHYNNVARIGFMVEKDKINPLLDVTFDGNHILNGDIISAKPTILITLKDENKFLALNDTADFNVFIKYPNQASEKRIYFASQLKFYPSQLPHNACKIVWNPEFVVDGKYQLIVQATDRSRNVSGAIDYNIQFEILNKQTVTEVLNYPNPFSTSTRFVFTLTGSELPDIFTIQIMTITGKVVKEITKSELGNIHIGKNITQYAWDGKDEFGDKLANGVYIYKVTIRQNGNAVEKNVNELEAYFKKGLGKMVILR